MNNPLTTTLLLLSFNAYATVSEKGQFALLVCGEVYSRVADKVDDVDFSREFADLSNHYIDLYEGVGGDWFDTQKVNVAGNFAEQSLRQIEQGKFTFDSVGKFCKDSYRKVLGKISEE